MEELHKLLWRKQQKESFEQQSCQQEHHSFNQQLASNFKDVYYLMDYSYPRQSQVQYLCGVPEACVDRGNKVS